MPDSPSTSEAPAKAEMASISVQLSAAPRGYDIVTRPGLIDELGVACRPLVAKNARVLLLTDETVAALYLQRAKAGLQAAGFEVTSCVVPSGEHSKTLAQAQTVYEALLAARLSRKDLLLALGGGVVGDLAGFCASTYHRGMPLVHVPTTLVAQVDSAIGGKTAVNFGAVKNIVGTFYQPQAVLIDTETLGTLPARERLAGMAEVVKYGLIETSCCGETGFFDWLCTQADQWSQAVTTDPAWSEMIHRCAAIKASVVMQDEFETLGLRYFLNLGHTFGHAYESLSDYGLLHGEAVAIGMIKAVVLAVRLGKIPADAAHGTIALLTKIGLGDAMAQARHYAPDALLAVMRQDKKNHGDAIRLILPDGALGRAGTFDDVKESDILSVLADHTL